MSAQVSALVGRVTRCNWLMVTALLCTLAAAACARSDESVEAELQRQLAADAVTGPAHLTASVQEGVARISGETETVAPQKRAIDIARAVKGVQLVESGMRLNDAALTRAVQAAIAADADVANVPLKVEVRAGEVLLISDQTNADQRTKLLAIARGVDGVTNVEDRMK